MFKENLLDEKKIHIGLFLPSLVGGGAERVMLNLAKQFLRRGIKVDLILVNEKGELVNQIPPGVNVIDFKAKRMFYSLPKMILYLRKYQPDYLLSSLDLANLISILVVKVSRLSTKVIVRLVANLPSLKFSQFKKRFERWLLGKLLPQADKIISISKGTAQNFSEILPVNSADIEVIYNPIISDALIFAANEQISFSGFNIKNTSFILGVGRLVPVKDFFSLIKAFSIVRKKKKVKLVILGEGELRVELEKLVSDLGLTEDVYIPGYISNPYPFMKYASVFVLSSAREGLGNVIIEAMACGCPVVATDCKSGPRELLNDGEYGHLVKVEDVEAIANAISQVLNGGGKVVPPEWLEQYKIEKVTQQYLDAIRSLKK